MINGWFISCKYEEISEYVWFNFVYKIIKKEFYYCIVMKNLRKIEYIKIYIFIYIKYVKKIFL